MDLNEFDSQFPMRGPGNPEASAQIAADSPPTDASPPRLVRGSDYLALPRQSETWLLEPVLPTSGSMLLYGDPKVGKSFAALQLAAALSDGADWLGYRSLRPCSVVYIQLDTPRSLWADRVGQLKTSGLSTDAIWFADRETLGTWPFDILDSSHQMLLYDALQGIENVNQVTGEITKGPDCVIIDTLRESHRGDENDATDMQKVMSHWTAVVKPAALIMVAHGRKSSLERGSSLINDNRGSNYVVGAVDAIAHMTAKGLEIGGRALDEAFIALERQPNGTWELQDRDRVRNMARELLATYPHLSLREKAKILATQSGRTVAASFSILQRLSSDLD